MATQAPSQIDPKLLEILRCPVAVHYTDKGDDPGRLELVRDTWLYCPDSGYKYPIIDGIPKMLIEEGARWKDTDIDDLPVPPPNDPVYAAAEEALTPEMQQVVDNMTTRADAARSGAVQQLRETARAIRRDARSETESSAASTRIEEIASGLERAAGYLDGSNPNPTPEHEQKMPLSLMAFMFALGVVIGLVLRGLKKSSS